MNKMSLINGHDYLYRFLIRNVTRVLLLSLIFLSKMTYADTASKPSFSLGAIAEVGSLVIPNARGTSHSTVSGFGGQGELRFIIPAGKTKANETLEIFAFGGEFKGKSGYLSGDTLQLGLGVDIAFRYIFVGGEGFTASISSVNGNYSYDTSYIGYGVRVGFRIPLSSSSNGTFLSLGGRFTTGQSYVQPQGGTRSVVDHNQLTGFLGFNVGLDNFF